LTITDNCSEVVETEIRNTSGGGWSHVSSANPNRGDHGSPIWCSIPESGTNCITSTEYNYIQGKYAWKLPKVYTRRGCINYPLPPISGGPPYWNPFYGTASWVDPPCGSEQLCIPFVDPDESACIGEYDCSEGTGCALLFEISVKLYEWEC